MGQTSTITSAGTQTRGTSAFTYAQPEAQELISKIAYTIYIT